MFLTDGESGWNFQGLFLSQVGFPDRNVRARSETILHIVLNVQVDRACFKGGVAGTNFGENV